MAAWGTLQAAALLTGATSVHGGVEAAEAGLAVLAGYVMADLGSGVFHWRVWHCVCRGCVTQPRPSADAPCRCASNCNRGVDNYGDASTPGLGGIIDSFQGHHARPWTITQREFCNNLAGPCAVHLAPLALLCAAPIPAPARMFAATFMLFTAMAQQTHAWSHLKRGEVPPVVLALQDAGVFVSCRAHGAHHKPPFSGQYCIVSGLWNDALDSGVLTAAERLIFDRTGVAPRGWLEPSAAWAPVAEE
jgi:ubiquitin-conjugating enzyme E2 variant